MSRSKVLTCFKDLHRARKAVFNEDAKALAAGRIRINEEFRKNQSEADPDKIQELIKFGKETATYLRKYVVQAKWDEERGAYQARITKDTHLLDNAPYTGPTETLEEWKASRVAKTK